MQLIIVFLYKLFMDSFLKKKVISKNKSMTMMNSMIGIARNNISSIQYCQQKENSNHSIKSNSTQTFNFDSMTPIVQPSTIRQHSPKN